MKINELPCLGKSDKENAAFSSLLRASRVSSGAPAVRSLRELALRAPAGSPFFPLPLLIHNRTIYVQPRVFAPAFKGIFRQCGLI